MYVKNNKTPSKLHLITFVLLALEWTLTPRPATPLEIKLLVANF